MSQTLEEYAKQKNMEPGELLRKNLGRQQKNMMRPATHVGKYTHSQAKDDMSVFCVNAKVGYGYLCFGNFESVLRDYIGNAANMPHAHAMESLMPDGRQVRQHLKEGTRELRQIAAVNATELKNWQDNFNQVQEQARICSRSNFKLKQVYFPLGNGTYQLLTLLPCSTLVWELKSRLAIREWEIREANSKQYNVRIAFIDRWNREYGGTKPQNISYLNSNNGGNARVLTCLPPSVNRDFQLPKRNFFNQIKIYIPRNPREIQKGVGVLFQSLHSTLLSDPNALWARKKKRGILRAIIERGIIMPAENIRENAVPGWSKGEKYSFLPVSQKAWLDPWGLGQDDAEENWQEEIAKQIARFVERNFEKMTRFSPERKKVNFDDAFRREISDLAKEYLDE